MYIHIITCNDVNRCPHVHTGVVDARETAGSDTSGERSTTAIQTKEKTNSDQVNRAPGIDTAIVSLYVCSEACAWTRGISGIWNDQPKFQRYKTLTDMSHVCIFMFTI